METNVGILAIGNEVVEGQVTNRNAAWLSEQLGQLGAQPLYHLSCRDQNQEILTSLNFLSRHCHLIIVTGGLGPTKDDFTRQSLSQWIGLPLEANAELWTEIKAKLTAREVTIREGHSNQALLPTGAQALPNSKGVAPGFVIKTDQCFLASLPGPPNELQPMFTDHLLPFIKEQIRPKAEQQLLKWVCLGSPESEVAHITESIFGDSVTLGYRLHKPYVEVKVWAPTEIDSDLKQRFDRLDEKLKPWHVGPSIKKIRQDFHDFLKQFKNVFVIDHLTQGLLLEKLKEDFRSDHLRYQCFEHKSFRYFSKNEVERILSHMEIEQNNDSLFISLFPASDHGVLISFNRDIRSLELPRRIPVTSKLGQLYSIEETFLWNRRGKKEN